MKRNFHPWDPFSAPPRKRIKVRYTIKPPDKLFLHRTRNHMSKLNNDCLNTFSEFINMEMVAESQSIYTLLLTDLIFLKPTFFGERFCGIFMTDSMMKPVPKTEGFINDELKKRVTKLLQSSIVPSNDVNLSTSRLRGANEPV